MSDSGNQKRTLPKNAVDLLRDWLYDNLQYPYPSEDQKNALSVRTNLEMKSINNWFINARRRLIKPLAEKIVKAYRLDNTESREWDDSEIIQYLYEVGKLGQWARSVSEGHSRKKPSKSPSDTNYQSSSSSTYSTDSSSSEDEGNEIALAAKTLLLIKMDYASIMSDI